MLSSSVNVAISVDGTVISYLMAASTAAVVLASLCLGYTYHLAGYENFSLGGKRYPQCPLYGTAKGGVEAETLGALAFYDIEKKFMSHSNKQSE